jgi:transcriptional regulator with XRE-family HTH domain
MSEQKQPSDLFPERLRAARKLRGMEQVVLASAAGIPPTSISHFEAGARKPSFDNLRRLAQALTVTTDYLLGRVDSPEMSLQADPLYRDMQKLTEEDRKLAQGFMQLLAKRRTDKDESSG